ncbi:Dihydroorotate dehydrogenase [Fervidicoccus fontis Kam940]|uniref:Dihydroorotate dehydrogenase n=2 Tax=Fervidicoccus fontis TaxID=683846 RepID=H9ZZW2_FERFK|nr:Dihydroorotate dehydrogenase [Fervidicoccus fontis Kam940]
MVILMTLNIELAGIILKNPLMNASGILGQNKEAIKRLYEYGFGAVVSKTITPMPRIGNKPPIILSLPNGGLINAVGLENPGKGTIKELVEEAKELNIPIIVSVGGTNEDEFSEVAKEAEISGANAIELNLSCPHTKGYGLEIGADPRNVFNVVKNVSSIIKIPVIAKLGLNDKIVEASGKALEAGAKALGLINTVKAIYIDVYTLKPVLSNIHGGLSGPPIHPIAVRVIYDVYREYRAEIIGSGGVKDWKDAAEFISAGAKAIQIGSALISNDDPKHTIKSILGGLENWLRFHNVTSLLELVGSAHRD